MESKSVSDLTTRIVFMVLDRTWCRTFVAAHGGHVDATPNFDLDSMTLFLVLRI